MSRTNQLQDLAEGLKGRSMYRAIHALLICWEEDDIGVRGELQDLGNVLSLDYGARVQSFVLPSVRPAFALEKALQLFKDAYSNPNNLLIVYYGGHGIMDDNRKLKLVSHGPCEFRMPDPSSVEWYPFQVGLQNTASDVLILLDACNSAGSSGSFAGFGYREPEGGTTELITACGFEAFAPSNGVHTFTRGLIKELISLTSKTSFEVTELHSRLLARLARRDAVNVVAFGRLQQVRPVTPVYVLLNTAPHQGKIVLTPRDQKLSQQLNFLNSLRESGISNLQAPLTRGLLGDGTEYTSDYRRKEYIHNMKRKKMKRLRWT